MSWQVYIVACRDGSLYTGIAKDLTTRIEQHNSGLGAKYTRGRGPVGLVYQETVANRSTAQHREYAIKRMSRAEKLQLINQPLPLTPISAADTMPWAYDHSSERD